MSPQGFRSARAHMHEHVHVVQSSFQFLAVFFLQVVEESGCGKGIKCITGVEAGQEFTLDYGLNTFFSPHSVEIS